MNTDLFTQLTDLTRVDLPDSDVVIRKYLDLPCGTRQAFKSILQDTPWRAEEVFVWGKRHLQPRLVAWYGDPGKSYHYSGVRLNPLPWTELLLEIKECVERVAEYRFNSVLLNLYRNGNDSMGMHSDDEASIGSTPTIASYSLGGERTLVFKHRTRKDIKAFPLVLSEGNLLIMRGVTQRFWLHGINKTTKKVSPRVNLTFRDICSS